MLNYLNQDYIETFAFGDGINDLEMMQIVNYPIAMDNACMEPNADASFLATVSPT